MKEFLISWWTQFFPIFKKHRGEEIIPDPLITEQVLPEGDNSLIKGIEENDAEEVPYQTEQSTNVNPDVVNSTVVDMSNIDLIDSEKPQEQQETTSVITPDETETPYESCVDVDKLVSLTVDSIRYFDQLRSQMPTDDLKTILDEVSRSMIDNLILSGCTPINEEPSTFDTGHHQVVPYQMVNDGTPYLSIIRPGIEYKGEVKLLAIVEL